MIPYLAQKYAQNQATRGIQPLFSLIQTYEVLNKMQAYDTAQSAQNFTQNTNGLKFIAVFLLGIFLVYAVQNHLITDAFSYALSLLFDNFSVKTSSVTADIVILIFFALALFGLWVLLVNFTTLLIIAAIFVAVGLFFMSSDDGKKPFKFTDDSKKEQVIKHFPTLNGLGG